MINKLKSFLNKGHQRNILAKKNILFSFFIKAFGMIVVFTMVSISIKYLGKESYGIWIVLSGLIAWSNVFDLGFSHGLRNRLAEAIAHNHLSEVGKYYVSTTYAFLIAIAITLAIIFIPIFSYLNWQNILNTTILDNETIKYTVLIIFGFFILQFIFKPIGAIFEAFQWPAISQFFTLLGGTLALFGVIYLLFNHSPSSLQTYAYLVAGSPVFIYILTSIYFYKQKFINLMPSVKYVRKKYFKSIAGLGFSFFIIQLSALVIFQSDNMIIAYLFGPEKVTDYNIVYRYFSIITIAVSVIMAPFWTAFTDAHQKNDLAWIKKTIKTLLSLTLLSLIGAVVLFLLSDKIYILWIGQSTIISPLLSGLMGLYVISFSLLNIFSFFANGIGKIRLQMIVYLLTAILNIPLSYFLGKTLMLGSSGVILATIICVTIVIFFLSIQYYMYITNKLEGIWNE